MAASLFDDPRVREIVGPGLSVVFSSIFRRMEIAEEEIAAARGTTEMDQDDPLWQAFQILGGNGDERMNTEFVYRAHCRELLERVKNGQDTRPATDAEISCAIAGASMAAPLPSPLVGLQARVFKRVFPEQYERIADDLDLDTYERMYGREMDGWEAKLRKKAGDRERVIS